MNKSGIFRAICIPYIFGLLNSMYLDDSKGKHWNIRYSDDGDEKRDGQDGYPQWRIGSPPQIPLLLFS